MYFQYDTSGAPLGFIYNGTQYFYLTNQMGDVISITDAQGNELVQYEYDEWGAVSIYTVHNSQAETALANANPLCYRGYYYDTETGYYYLQSRYYDPSICRFINSDIAEIAQEYKTEFNSLSLFLYCVNNPVNKVDYTGYWGKEVHYGYSNKTKNHYNYTMISRYSTPYGTYCWAVNCGFTTSNAKKISQSCYDVDKIYSSTTYSTALVANSSYGGPHYTSKQLNTYWKWQGYHFNLNKSGKDSRLIYADQMLTNAKKQLEKRKKSRCT